MGTDVNYLVEAGIKMTQYRNGWFIEYCILLEGMRQLRHRKKRLLGVVPGNECKEARVMLAILGVEICCN